VGNATKSCTFVEWIYHENGVDFVVIMHNMIKENEKCDSTFNHKYFLELYTTCIERYQILYPLTFEWFAQSLWTLNNSINIQNYVTTLWNTCGKLRENFGSDEHVYAMIFNYEIKFWTTFKWKHVMMVHFRHENVFIFWYILYYFKGKYSFISSSVLINIQNGFFTQNFQHNFCYLSHDSVFSTNFYVFTNLHLFEWTTSSRCFLRSHMSGIFHIELKLDIEIICNIWLSTSSNLIIIWMGFEVYLHFGIYCVNYNFSTNIFLIF
jgi:hypothetical protein